MIMSAAFSAIITTGALVLPDTSMGMIEPGKKRRHDHPKEGRRVTQTGTQCHELNRQIARNYGNYALLFSFLQYGNSASHPNPTGGIPYFTPDAPTLKA